MTAPDSERSAHGALRTAAVVGAAAFLSVVPQLYYLAVVARVGGAAGPLAGASAGALFRAELASATFVVLVTAVTGAFFARRYGLAGTGELRALRTMRVELLLAGAIGLATYLLLGRQLALRAPPSYPPELGWAVARLAKGAIFEEVVARYGMMTILCGVVRKPAAANLLQAFFFTLLGLGGLSAYGLRLEATPLLGASLGVTFATNLWLGSIYARRGLLAAVAIHGMLGAQYLVHALAGAP